MAEAEVIVKAAQAKASCNGWAVTVAVVDDSGTPVLVSRLDEAAPSSVTTAIEKARSAVNTGLSTKVLEDSIRDRPGIITIGRVAVEGGLPILYKGQNVGGVGVSGVKSDQDALVAQAGIEALQLSS